MIIKYEKIFDVEDYRNNVMNKSMGELNETYCIPFIDTLNGTAIGIVLNLANLSIEASLDGAFTAESGFTEIIEEVVE